MPYISKELVQTKLNNFHNGVSIVIAKKKQLFENFYGYSSQMELLIFVSRFRVWLHSITSWAIAVLMFTWVSR